jgi:hypothetical protein
MHGLIIEESSLIGKKHENLRTIGFAIFSFLFAFDLLEVVT